MQNELIMTLAQPLRLKGAPGSPYTRKMLAYMRYRHINYELLIGDQLVDDVDLPTPKVELLPTFYLPNDQGQLEAVVDSTPLIRRFEDEIPGRETLPENPVLGFIPPRRKDNRFTKFRKKKNVNRVMGLNPTEQYKLRSGSSQLKSEDG